MIEKQILKKTWTDRFLKIAATFLFLEVFTMLVMVPYMIGRASVEPCDQLHEQHTSSGTFDTATPVLVSWADQNAVEAHSDLLHITVNQPDCDQETIRVHTGASVIDVTIGPARVEATVNSAAVPTTRSAGSNSLRNVGAWLDASGGQTNTTLTHLEPYDTLTVWPQIHWASTGWWGHGWITYPTFGQP